MGLSAGNAWRNNLTGRGEWFVLFGTWFFALFLYSLFALGIRGTQFNSPIPGLELMPAIVTGFAFLLASRPFVNATGGFVFWTHAFVTLIIGWAFTRVFGGSKKGFPAKINTMADPNYLKLNWIRLIIATFAMFLGTFLAVVVIWLFTGDSVVFVPHSPGPFPGFFPPGFDPLIAFAFEAVAAGALGIILTFFALVGGVKRRMVWNPAKGESGEMEETFVADSSGYHSGLFIAAFGVAAAVALGFNITGTCLDVMIWTAEHLMVGIVLGQAPFTGGPFADVDEYWWVYAFGAMTGWAIGVLIGYFLAAISVGAWDEGEAPEEETDVEEMGLMARRLNARAVKAGAPMDTPKKVRRDVDSLADNLFGGVRE